MKSIIFITITLTLTMNAQDLRIPSVNDSINIKNWMNTPHVKGRHATLDDVKNDRAVYGSDSHQQKYIPIDLNIPFLALKEDPILEGKDTVVVIQAHKINQGIYVGYKSFHGSFQGTSLLKDLTIIDDSTTTKKEKKEVFNHNSTNNNIELIIPNCGIDSRWNRLKYSLNQEYFAAYEQKRDLYGGNFLIKKYDPSRVTIPNFIVKGLNLKNNIFTKGKWISRMLYIGESIPFSIDNVDHRKNYHIYAQGNLIKSKEDQLPYFDKIENYELIVVQGKNRQTIRKMDLFSFSSGGFEGGITIHWIGDLNNDKQLDMLVGISQHYAGETLHLFLSNNTKTLFNEYEVGGCSFD